MIFVQVQNKIVSRMIYSHLVHVRTVGEREGGREETFSRGSDCTSKYHTTSNGGLRRRALVATICGENTKKREANIRFRLFHEYEMNGAQTLAGADDDNRHVMQYSIHE